MLLSLPYGSGYQTAVFKDVTRIVTLETKPSAPLADPVSTLRQQMQTPYGSSKSFYERMHGADSACVILSDAFRYTGMERLLPTLLRNLTDVCGIAQENVTLLIATGTHRDPTEDELQKILGPTLYTPWRHRVVVHNAFDSGTLVDLGVTSRGTPIRVNRHVLECDRLIVTGTVVLHYFAGFGGGWKAIVPGVAGAETIAANHSLNLHPTEPRLDPRVRIGVMQGNPVAEDFIEAAARVPAHFLINTVLTPVGEIAAVFAGDMDTAHRHATEFARNAYVVPIREQAELVIASAGDTKNFLQSHKALFNAYQSLKPGGVLVFLAQAEEGFGGHKFQDWLKLGSPEAVVGALRKRAEINGQTALSTLQKARDAILLTALPEEAVRFMGAHKVATLQEGVDLALRRLREKGIDNPLVYVLPHAAHTVPQVLS
jgi:nickel-dependent lactate racemase